MPDADTVLARLADEAAIRDATARFADAAMRGDYDSFRALWAEDGDWAIGDPARMQVAGVDDIVAMLRQLRSDKEFFVQFAIQGAIAIDGDEAVTSTIGHEAGRGPGESYYRNHYVSTDRLRRAGDRWVFTHRTYRYIWLDTSPFGGESFTLTSPKPTA